jgi:hypothetical protein
MNKDLDLGSDQVENLVGTLIAEAPADVVQQMMAKTKAPPSLEASTASTTGVREKSVSSGGLVPPSPPVSDLQTASQSEGPISEELRKELLALQELIRRRLEGGGANAMKDEEVVR